MSQESPNIHTLPEWMLKEFQKEAYLDAKGHILTAVTTLAMIGISCLVALKTDSNMHMAAKTAFYVSLVGTGIHFILANQAEELATDIGKELSSRKPS